jgi:hypothetical protein
MLKTYGFETLSGSESHVALTRGAGYWLTCSGNVVAAYAVIRGLQGLVACRAIVRYGISALALTLWPRLNRASYHVLRWPLLALVYTIVSAEFAVYLTLRVAVSGLEAAVATPSHRALRTALSRAPDYASWLGTARALDASRGAALWQADLRSTRYNWPFVKGRSPCGRRLPGSSWCLLQQRATCPSPAQASSHGFAWRAWQATGAQSRRHCDYVRGQTWAV